MRLQYGLTPKPDYVSAYRNIEVEALYALVFGFPVSADWLLTGRGEMLKSAPAPEPEPEAQAPADPAPAAFVSIPADAWNVIKQQAASLERKDRQVDRVIALLEDALNERKKELRPDAPSGPFAPSGTVAAPGSKIEHL